MAEYRISAKAKSQLLDIEKYTDVTFGRYQADAYITGFQKTFELLAMFPGIGRTADELRAGHRRYRYQSHTIFSLVSPATS